MNRRRLVVGISGATGISYGLRILEHARKAGLETHLVVTPAGQQTRAYETDLSVADLAATADGTCRLGPEDRPVRRWRPTEWWSRDLGVTPGHEAAIAQLSEWACSLSERCAMALSQFSRSTTSR
ncbi:MULTISPECIES: flavoprotein [Kitasatospora]|uniref:Flavoprotein domain-containing protein n=1 Tax=Kitasatospora cystarginea TaxID=58350 RepID=A0ABP5RTT7_9ACTN